MNAFFAMNVLTTNDDRGYLLWAAQNWMFLVVPTLVLITFIIAWVVQQVRACSAGMPGGSAPPDSLSGVTGGAEMPESPSGAEPEGQAPWSFIPAFGLVRTTH